MQVLYALRTGSYPIGESPGLDWAPRLHAPALNGHGYEQEIAANGLIKVWRAFFSCFGPAAQQRLATLSRLLVCQKAPTFFCGLIAQPATLFMGSEGLGNCWWSKAVKGSRWLRLAPLCHLQDSLSAHDGE